MRDEGVIYVAGHPLLNRRCTRLPGCIRLWNDLYCVEWGVKLYSLTALLIKAVVHVKRPSLSFSSCFSSVAVAQDLKKAVNWWCRKMIRCCVRFELLSNFGGCFQFFLPVLLVSFFLTFDVFQLKCVLIKVLLLLRACKCEVVCNFFLEYAPPLASQTYVSLTGVIGV